MHFLFPKVQLRRRLVTNSQMETIFVVHTDNYTSFCPIWWFRVLLCDFDDSIMLLFLLYRSWNPQKSSYIWNQIQIYRNKLGFYLKQTRFNAYFN